MALSADLHHAFQSLTLFHPVDYIDIHLHTPLCLLLVSFVEVKTG